MIFVSSLICFMVGGCIGFALAAIICHASDTPQSP
jgi:hypothetical protein